MIILRDEIQKIERQGEKLVFANGCFDILHVGHVYLLERAATLGRLLVAVNDDASVSRLKPGRPIVRLEDRMTMLAALKCVTWVTSFHEDTPLEIIKEVKPDFLVKGSDYGRLEVVGADEMKGWGGQVFIAPLKSGYSTTSFIERVRCGDEWWAL